MFIIPRHLLLTIALLSIVDTTTYGQNEPVFLGDINQEEGGSNPRNFIVAGANAYFIASSGIGYEVWRTNGTEEGTFPLSWFNDKYEDTDWKHLISYDASRFIIHAADGIYITTGIESSVVKLSDAGIESTVYVSGDLILWSETDPASGIEIVFASDGTSANTRVILEVNSLKRIISLEEATLISVTDLDGSLKTFNYDGLSQSFTTFADADVLAADRTEDGFYFTAIGKDGNQFELYSKDGFTDVVDQLTSFSDILTPNYTTHDPSVLVLGEVVFFTKLVERNGQLEEVPELHRYHAGQVGQVGTLQEGFKPDFIYPTDFGILLLDGTNLYRVSADGDMTVLHNDEWIMDRYSFVNYHLWDGNRVHYYAGFPGDANLVVSDGSPLGTYVVSENTTVGGVSFEVGMTNVEKPSAAFAVLGNLIVMPGFMDGGQNELWLLDKNSGSESFVKNISTETRSLSWNEQGFIKYDGKLYLFGSGEIWRIDGSPEGTIQLLREGADKFLTLPRFIPDFEELYLFGLVSRSMDEDSYALVQVDGDRLVEKWRGALESDRGVKYITRMGNEAVFSAPPISFSFDLTQGVTQLKQPFSSTFPKGFSSVNREYLWPHHYTVVGDRLFIRGADGIGSSNWDVEPWTVSLANGSASLIKDINPDGHSFPREFVEFDGQVVFNARQPFHRESIYITDGTHDGTTIFFDDFTDANEETSISNLITIRDSLYFNSLHQGTQRFITVGHDRSFTILGEREFPVQSQFADFAEEIFEMGYFIVHHDGDAAQWAYDVASDSILEVDWSMLPTRHIELGNYFFDALSYGSISRWDKLTLEEDVYSNDPNGELPYTTLGSKLIILKYAEGFGHELWSLDVGRQDRQAHLDGMEVVAGKPFLPYVSDIETAQFTFSSSTPDAIIYENGRFKGVMNGEHTLDLHFEEDEIYNSGTIAVTVHVTEGKIVSGHDPLPELKVFPNPTSDRLTVSSPQIGLARMIVIDLSGRFWETSLTGARNTSLELGHLPEGLYILQLEGIHGRRTTCKILIQR